jgi:NhaA family Na+:H+ antiporter
MRRIISPLSDFLHRESSSGIVLLFAAFCGMVVANSPLSDRYFSTLELSFEIEVGIFYLKLSMLKFINYALMTLFFFVVGLEIKRELTSGHLATFRKAVIPFIAAVGGMALPAGIYLLIAGREAPDGWGVPVATDIALAVGLLAIIGNSVTPALRTFLLGLAVIDDIGAILIIAFIYSTGVKISWLAASALTVLAILLVKKIGAQSTYIYIFFGVLLWYGLYRTGIHPTLAGVILGMMTPNTPKIGQNLEDVEDGSLSVIEWLEFKIHPWSSFAIIPLFAFANTGVVITLSSLQDSLSSPIAWGIFFGLVVGKPLGILSAVLIAKRLNIGDLPEGSGKTDIIATGSAAGIGFTVAIFIANLAFKDEAQQDLAVISVIVASLVSGLISWIIFIILKKKKSLQR